MSRKSLLLVALFVEGGLFFVGLLLMGASRAEAWSRFDLSWRATAYALLLCVPMLAMLYLSERTQWPPLARLRDELDEKVMPIFANCKIVDLAIIALLAGASEELFFRGWLQGVLINKFDVLLGILIASAIFGFMHYLSPIYAIYAGLTGLYLGLIYQTSGNLYIVMVIHAAYDFIALVALLIKGRRSGVGVRVPSEMEES
jgi:membrane protease YdiL (CAAX protease family)